jgi:TPR repeat protein
LKAIDKGNVSAMYNYAVCLSDGIYGSRDIPSSMKYFKLAADKGLQVALLEFNKLKSTFNH